jgi:tight adherence protein B
VSGSGALVLILAGTLLAVVVFVAGVRNLVDASSWQKELTALVYDDDLRTGSARQRWDRRFRRTRPGRWVEQQLVLSGIRHRPVDVVVVTTAAGLVATYLLARLMAPVFGLLGLVLAAQGLRVFLRRARDKRREDFIAQMPELARVLANATSAGLSIRTAIEMAGDELSEPARTEMQRVSDSMRFGGSLDDALGEITQRLPSREIAVLIYTLLVSARSGGSLVTSLRDIADTLESRKEVRREVRTILAQSVLTGYMVIGMGVLILIAVNGIRPGTIELMTQRTLGQIAFVIAAVLYVLGMLMIRRIARIEP